MYEIPKIFANLGKDSEKSDAFKLRVYTETIP